MRRTAFVAAALVALAGASCAKDFRFGGKLIPLGKQEMVFIRVVQDADKRCKLATKTPSEIRTDSDGSTGPGQIKWVITGSCPGSRVAISPEFKKGGGRRHQIVTGLTTEGVAATAGEEITATVRRDLPLGLKKGVYRFQILIDGKPAEYNSPADEGYFFMCPVWPCGDFKYED